MVLTGHVKNNSIILDQPIELPDGIAVKVMVSGKPVQKSSGLCGIWQDDRPAEEIVDEIISARSKGKEIKS